MYCFRSTNLITPQIKQHMKKFLLILLVSALPLIVFAQAPAKGPLDGKTFEGLVTKDGKKKPMDPDELKFAAGKYKSKNFSELYKFKNAPYIITGIDSTTTPGVKIYTWSSEATNDIKDVATWQGTINGEDIEGTVELVTKKGDAIFSCTFTGKLKKKAGQK